MDFKLFRSRLCLHLDDLKERDSGIESLLHKSLTVLYEAGYIIIAVKHRLNFTLKNEENYDALSSAFQDNIRTPLLWGGEDFGNVF